jgi:HK97 family phage prohead protease
MPTPHPGDETRSEWMHRCVPIVLEDGTASTQNQAVAICSSMWEDAGKTAAAPLEHRAVRLLETKATDEVGRFSGYGAVFGNEDSTGDVIQRGAFADSLREWKARGKLPPMLLQHGGGPFGGGASDLLPVGQWRAMAEDPRGLHVEGQLFALGTEKGQYLYEGLKSGVLDGLSIGYRTRDAKAKRPGDVRMLTNLDLWEVSIVTFPANAQARVMAVKALTPANLRDVEDFLYRDLKDELGFSHVTAKRVVASIRKYLHRDGGGDDPAREHRDGAAADESDRVLEALADMQSAVLSHALQRLTSTIAARRD